MFGLDAAENFWLSMLNVYEPIFYALQNKLPILSCNKFPSSWELALLTYDFYCLGQRPPKISNIPKALSDMISKYVSIILSYNVTWTLLMYIALFHTINRCWDNEPQNRPSMNELRVKLEKLCEVCVCVCVYMCYRASVCSLCSAIDHFALCVCV